MSSLISLQMLLVLKQGGAAKKLQRQQNLGPARGRCVHLDGQVTLPWVSSRGGYLVVNMLLCSSKGEIFA